MGWIAVALAYAGAVVGAGFASGQEIWVFFSRHGTAGTWGILLSGVAFSYMGFRALEYGARGTGDYRGLLALAYPPRMERLLETLASAFLAGGLVVVAAGAGSAAHALLGVPAPLGSAAMLVMTIAVATRGASGVLAANTVLVPILVAVALGVSLRTPGRVVGPGAPHWWLSSLLYVSYNLFTGLMALLGLGRLVPARADRVRAALVGAGLLAVMAFVVHRALLGVGTVDGALPLLQLARALGPIWTLGYGIAFASALVTTGVAQAFAMGERFGSRRLWWLLLLWPVTWLGFERLVAEFYPVMGVLSVLIWWPLLASPRRLRKGW